MEWIWHRMHCYTDMEVSDLDNQYDDKVCTSYCVIAVPLPPLRLSGAWLACSLPGMLG